MPEKEYKFKKGKALPFSAYRWEAEPGDKMVDLDGKLYLLEESKGMWQSAAGFLTYRTIKPPHPNAKAVLRDDKIFWKW